MSFREIFLQQILLLSKEKDHLEEREPDYHLCQRRSSVVQTLKGALDIDSDRPDVPSKHKYSE